MSIDSAFGKDNLKCDEHESSDFPKMSELLRDSNILLSKKTYGRKKISGSLPVCCENNGSFSTVVGDLGAEKDLESTENIPSSSYDKNNYQKDVDSEFSLFSDDGTDYYVSGSEDNFKDKMSSINETVSSGSKYQRTRKNLKNYLNNEQNNSGEIFKSQLHVENSNSVADANELKSASDFLNRNKGNHETSEDESDNKLPEKSNKISTAQAPEKPIVFGKAHLFTSPLINQSYFSLIDLVKRFSKPRNESCAIKNSSSKKIKECELAPEKKESVANRAGSSKINSSDKKTLNSTVSDLKTSENYILKSDRIYSSNLDVKKGDITTSKSVWQRKGNSFDKVERSVNMIGYVRNTNTSRKNGAKTPSKAARRKNFKKSLKVLTKYQSKNTFAKNDVKSKVKSSITQSSNLLMDIPWKSAPKTHLEAVERENIRRSIKVLTKFVSKSKCVKKDVKAKVKSSITRKGSNLLMDKPRKSGRKIPSKAMQMENIQKSIKVLSKFVSENKRAENDVKPSTTCTTSNLHLVRNGTTGKIQLDCDKKQIKKLPFEKAMQNQFLNNIPVIVSPIPAVSLETIPFCMRSINTSVTDDHSIQNDNQAVSHENFELIAIPGTSTLNNNHFSVDTTTPSDNPVCIQSVQTSVADDHSIPNGNQAVSHGNFKNLAIKAALNNNHSSMDATTSSENSVCIQSDNTSVADDQSIQNDNQAVSHGNFEHLATSGTSTSNDNNSGTDTTTYSENIVPTWSINTSIADGHATQNDSRTVSHRNFEHIAIEAALNNNHSGMDATTSLENPVCIQRDHTSVADDHSIQNDNQAVSHWNFEHLAFPGASTLNNNDSSLDTTSSSENSVCIQSDNTSVADDQSIQNDNQAVSHGNFEHLATSGASTLNDNNSSTDTTTYSENIVPIQSFNTSVADGHVTQNDNQTVSHRNFEHIAIEAALNNNHSGMDATTSLENPVCIQSDNTSVADDHSIQNDNQAVSHWNFEHLAFPGASTLNDNDSSMDTTTSSENSVCILSDNTSVTDDHSIQNDNQAVSPENFEYLAIPGPSTLTDNDSSMDTTTSSENHVYHEQERRVGSRTSLGVSFEQFANNYFQKTENMCLLRKVAMTESLFSTRTSLRNITVSHFCNFPHVKAVFSDYLNDCISLPLNYHDINPGYDFPVNFEEEPILSVIKDFVHSITCNIIPKDGPKPSSVSYLQIFSAALHKMSIRESAIVMRVFRKSSSENLKLDDMLSKLNFVAMLVIFDEYKRRNINIRN